MIICICPHCGSQGTQDTITQSNLLTELGVWFMCLVFSFLVGFWLLLVAVGFSIWRGSTAKKGCRVCKQPGMVPINTPAGADLVARYGNKARTP